jgi:hypothetical protein
MHYRCEDEESLGFIAVPVYYPSPSPDPDGGKELVHDATRCDITMSHMNLQAKLDYKLETTS